MIIKINSIISMLNVYYSFALCQDNALSSLHLLPNLSSTIKLCCMCYYYPNFHTWKGEAKRDDLPVLHLEIGNSLLELTSFDFWACTFTMLEMTWKSPKLHFDMFYFWPPHIDFLLFFDHSTLTFHSGIYPEKWDSLHYSQLWLWALKQSAAPLCYACVSGL